MSETELQNNSWTSEDPYTGEGYDEVAELTLKKELDQEIRDIIIGEIVMGEIESPVVVELGCGRSPIVGSLTRENSNINGYSYDFSSGMAKGVSEMANARENMTFNNDGDITDLKGFTDLKYQPKADFVVLENVLYATTVPGEGDIHHMLKDEASFVETTVIKNAASVMKEDGLLILTDPLAGARSLDVKGVIKFFNDEFQATVKENQNKYGNPKYVETVASLLKRNASPAGKTVLSSNRELMERSFLHPDIESLTDLIEKDGLFDVVYERDDAYLGHNGFIVARRTKVPMTNHIQKFNMEVPLEYNGGYQITQPIGNILNNLGEYLQVSYAESGVNRNLPILDEFDKTSETFIISAANSTVPIVSVKLNRVEMGTLEKLEMASLMTVVNENTSLNFYQSLLEALPLDSDGNRPAKIGELRRFAYSGPASLKYIIKSFERIFDKMMPYLNGEDRDDIPRADVLVCVADEARVKFFNRGLKSFNLSFEKLDGFKLDRDNIENQTLFLSSESYFLEKTELDESEQKILENIRSYISKNSDIGDWQKILNMEISNDDKQAYFAVVEKILNNAKDGVNIYCLDLRK
jgi:hypothetical protein